MDSSATHTRLLFAISEFHAEWQRGWRQSEDLRAEERKLKEPPGRYLALRRNAYIHCHKFVGLDDSLNAITSLHAVELKIRPDSQYPFIGSDSSWLAVCPTWLLTPTILMAQDETIGRDGALLVDLRARVRSARATLLGQLDSAAAQWPGDGWITGQRIRFRIDQRDFEGALQAAASCTAARWWCVALVGYVQATRGNVALAESTFTTMRLAMSDSVRCAWEDVRDLLSPAASTSYQQLACSAQAELNERLWWLADPLFRERGNERWVEQERRRVEVALHRATTQDERYSWDIKRGGDALVRMVERYGWPTYTSWTGEALDNLHSQYLYLKNAPAPPYTTFEYSIGRIQALPSWRALMAPLEAKENDWLLSVTDTVGRPAINWWPTEHYRPARPLVPLGVGQIAFLRRQSNIVVATATPFQHQSVLADTSLLFDVMLLATTGASRIDTVAQREISGGTTAALLGVVPSAPVLLAIEGRARNGVVDARTRWGVAPPPTLAAMKAGEIALSDPVLIDMHNGTTNMTLPAEELLDQMLGTLQLSARTRRVGLYWETYGISATDTVSVAVRVAGDQDLSGVRRVGMALNVASDPNHAIAIRWKEPDVQHSTRTLVGPVPVQMRTLALNLEQLAPGPYILEVSITWHGNEISSRRRILLAR